MAGSEKKPEWVNYYDILGVDRFVDRKGICDAYRQLILIWHPDKITDSKLKPSATEMFTKISEAYNILTNQESRNAYDEEWDARNGRKRAQSYEEVNARKKVKRFRSFSDPEMQNLEHKLLELVVVHRPFIRGNGEKWASISLTLQETNPPPTPGASFCKTHVIRQSDLYKQFQTGSSKETGGDDVEPPIPESREALLQEILEQREIGRQKKNKESSGSVDDGKEIREASMREENKPRERQNASKRNSFSMLVDALKIRTDSRAEIEKAKIELEQRKLDVQVEREERIFGMLSSIMERLVKNAKE